MASARLLGASCLAALGLTLSFPEPGFGGVVIIAIWPLLWALERCRHGRDALLVGWLTGTLFMALFHRWMWALTAWVHPGWIALLWVVFSAYLGLFYGASVWGMHKLRHKVPLHVLVPSLWIISEFIRSLGPIGNPAGTLGYATTSMPYIMQWAQLIGVYGLSFLVVLISVLGYQLITQRKGALLLGIIAVISLGYGAALYHLSPQDDTVIKVAAIQGNHPQSQKLNPEYWPYIRQSYVALSQRVMPESPDLILWPETVTPYTNAQSPVFMSTVRAMLTHSNTHLLFGTPTFYDDAFYNSAVLTTSLGFTSTPAHKRILMPFGEYWPFKSLLNRLGLTRWAGGNDYSPGAEPPLLKASFGTIGVANCLESLYPWHSRELVQHGAQLLVTLANNAWFFDSPAARQHLQMTRLRAVEYHRSMIQVSNTGYSALITPKGAFVTLSKLDEQTILSDTVSLYSTRTLYSYTGDIIVLLVVLLVLGYEFGPKRSSSKSS